MEARFKRRLILSSSIIGCVLILFAVAFYFLSNDLTNKAMAIAANRAALQQQTVSVSEIANLKQQQPLAAPYESAMAQLLVPEAQLLDFPHWLDGLGRVRQVSVIFAYQENQTPPTSAAAGYANFSLQASGNLPDILDFLQDVESRSPRFLVQIDHVDIVSSGQYRASTVGKVFFK